jgi:hypothetical protein
MPAILAQLVSVDQELTAAVIDMMTKFPRLCGYIICDVDTKTLEPKLFWNGSFFQDFGRGIENPKTFSRIERLTRSLKIHQARNPQLNLHICFWFHPECHYEPLDRYRRMSGNQFPGSPRQ